MFVSGDLDHISLTRTPQGQGVANRENVVALWKRILFPYLGFKYSRSTIPGIYLTVFVQRAQPHLQKLGYQ
jgi:hypothetical protein